MSLLPYTTGLIALGMLGLSSSHFAAVGLRTARSSLRARGVRLRQQSRLRRESQRARLASELSWLTATDQQNAWRVVEVVEIVDESADCRSFYLRDPLGAALPDFRPGQFVMVRPALGGAGEPTRCYSLSDAPGQSWWRITVKRQQLAPSAAAARVRGSLSVWLHERIGVGDCLLVNGPCGEFVLDERRREPIVLLAAGIGVTPMVSMLKHALNREPARRVQLFFQVQDADHWPLGQMLHEWQLACPTLSVSSYFSRRPPVDTPAAGSIHAGKFAASDVVDRLENWADAAYYLCGPDAWMHTLIENLKTVGIRSEQIHYESFGAATVNRNDTLGVLPVEPWSVSFARSGLHLETSSQPATIWEAAAAGGLKLPSGCHSGACGSCRLRLLRGNVHYRTQPQCSVSDGEILACVAQAVGDVVVDA